MTVLSDTSIGRTWLGQFDDVDRETAIDLIEEILLVSREDFFNGLDSLLNDFAGARDNAVGKIALYAERPIKKVFGTVPSFFPKARHGRAKGPGVPPIVVDPRNQEVGSEGIIAQFITDYCRQNPSICLSHPGPTKMRDEKIREIVIVTDFIGSGDRIKTMLESFRYVATIRSWRSYKLIRFCVIAYSGTSKGVNFIRSHKLKPKVCTVMGCPTIENTFSGFRRHRVEELCRTYPKSHSSPLGYKDSGALIAFAHGCPNNVPPILHSKSGRWIPLLKGRSTSSLSNSFLPEELERLHEQKATKLLRVREARSVIDSFEQKRWISMMLILAAAENGVQTPERISARTHLSVEEITELVSMAINARYLSDDGTLKRLGRYELARLRRRRKRRPALAGDNNEFYYPTQLRVP